MAITAKQVMDLRAKTGLGMMDCKKALNEADGDEDLAIEILRKKGLAKMAEKLTERTTEEGIIAMVRKDGSLGLVELLCESAPVTTNEGFVQLANDIAEVVASNPEFATTEELMAQKAPNFDGTLQNELDELFNRIREVFRVKRFLKVDGLCSSYLHHDHKSAVLLLLEAGDEAVGRDICMHIAAMKPQGLRAEDLDQAVIENEKRIQLELMNADPKNANKPDAIKEKIINGSMHKFLAQKCLLSQPFVKEPSLTVEQFANQNGLKIIKFVHWILGK
ncbi:MAG: translation elongation factor Ts [Thermoguttaceae bacterium]|nr:translation elongation factor Ts [Thermoguttaceae bacterium]MDO4857836.1 translation elongation factor Ts [Thermoguttaceae bacterium]